MQVLLMVVLGKEELRCAEDLGGWQEKRGEIYDCSPETIRAL